MENHLLEIITLVAYLVILPLLGLLFSKLNSNLSDYVRGGGQATWWLSGTSMLMAGISAFTFTGNASAAFQAGPSVLIIYVGNTIALLVGASFLAAWFRQTRAYTVADMVRSRFGPAVEQFYAYTGVILGPFGAAIQLWALSVFAASFFGWPIIYCIVGIGLIVVFYSTSGGKWAVMATDFVQSLILFSITIVVAYLCYVKVGGFDGFFSYFSQPEFKGDFSFVKPDSWAADNLGKDDQKFSMKWIVVIFFMTLYQQVGMNSADRYLAAKDGREARLASLLGAVLMAFGALVWFFPPMVARFLYGTEIMAQDINNPANTAYSFIAQKVLPNGLMGIMIAAMFSATMSSMDSGLNRQVGIIARNVIPPLRRAFGKIGDLSPSKEVSICRWLTVALGIIIIGYSIMFALNKEIVLFDAYLIINSTVGIPLVFPTLAGFWVRRMPSWSYFVVFGCCLLPSAYSVFMDQVYDVETTIQQRAMWIFIAGIIGTIISMLCWPLAKEDDRNRINEFFKRMHTPVDFKKEIGESKNFVQLRLLGLTSTGVGLALCSLLIVPNDMAGRYAILFVSGFCTIIGVLLLWGAKVEKGRVLAEEEFNRANKS